MAGFVRIDAKRLLRAATGADLQFFQIENETGPQADLVWINLRQVTRVSFRADGSNFRLEFEMVKNPTILSQPFPPSQLDGIVTVINRLFQRPGGEAHPLTT